jgi:polysaccharide export outer membrane protein
VRDDGAISIPQVGPVEIRGLTIDEAEQRLFERFVEAGLGPNFSLEVAEFNSRTVTVGGAVGSPAVLPVTLNMLTLDEALTAAGGIQVSTPEFASIRIYRDGTLYQIPLNSYTQSGEFRSTPLAPGDSVFVDTTYDLDRALEYFTQEINVANQRREVRAAALQELQAEISLRRAALEEARSLFQTRTELGAEERDYVYLAGEVGEQARFPLPYNQQATLADALYENQGFENETANPSEIYVLRASEDPFGPVTAWHLNARNAANLVLATEFQLRPNDIIFIEEQPITRWNRAFQQFFPTLISTATSAAGE